MSSGNPSKIEFYNSNTESFSYEYKYYGKIIRWKYEMGVYGRELKRALVLEAT